MNLRKIKSIDNKAKREAQRAVNAIYNKYNPSLIKAIKEQVKNGCVLVSGNGLCTDSKREGKAWGNNRDDTQFDYLTTLQYNNELYGGFHIPYKIKGCKP